MPDAHESPLDELLSEVTRQREAAVDQFRHLSTVSATVTSGTGLLTVEVGSQGEIRSLAFHSRRYRLMAPAELSEAIVETVERARQKVRHEVLQALPASLLGGVPTVDLADGEVDPAAVLPDTLEDAFGFLLRSNEVGGTAPDR